MKICVKLVSRVKNSKMKTETPQNQSIYKKKKISKRSNKYLRFSDALCKKKYILRCRKDMILKFFPMVLYVINSVIRKNCKLFLFKYDIFALKVFKK